MELNSRYKQQKNRWAPDFHKPEFVFPLGYRVSTFTYFIVPWNYFPYFRYFNSNILTAHMTPIPEEEYPIILAIFRYSPEELTAANDCHLLCIRHCERMYKICSDLSDIVSFRMPISSTLAIYINHEFQKWPMSLYIFLTWYVQ